MSKKFIMFCSIIGLVGISLLGSGCTVIFQKGRRVDVEKIAKLKDELTELERAKAELEDRLRQEIDDKEVKVENLARGLVITFVADVLFDSGKAVLREDSLQKLDKVSQVLNTTVKDLSVGIEGHTDSDPIKHSPWKDNWELSAQRALSVLRYIVERHKINPDRLSATGYGEQHPVSANTNKEGKQKNRRVEIVILPPTEKKGR